MRLLLLTLIFTPQILMAQITVTSSDFADADDTVRMSRASDPLIDFSATGTNFTWDFSALVAESQFLMDFNGMSNVPAFINLVYGTFAPAKYQASYYLPNDDIPLDQMGAFLPVNIEDVFQFTRKTADSITSIGYALSIDGNQVPFKSDTIETRYKFPLNYGNVHTTRGYTNMDMNPIFDAIWRQYRQRVTQVDGWGTVTTPYGTFDAIRIKHSIMETDSLRFPIFGNPTWIELPIPDSYIYEWWTNGEQEAVMRIETSIIGGTEVVTGIEYKDNYLGLDAGMDDLSEIAVTFYPNPATDELIIEGVGSQFEYSILDQNGRLIAKGKNNKHIDLRGFKPGQYYLWLISEKGRGLNSFIKQ